MNDRAGVMDSYRLGEVMKASARKLGERCGYDAVDMLSRRLTEYIGSADDDKFSYIWRSAIEDHEQDDHKDGTRAVLVDAVRDSALGATSSNDASSANIARLLLQSPYPTLTRIGIYVCSEHYGAVGLAFWECALSKWFVDISYWHELYWLIKKNFSRFSVVHRAQYLQFIDRMEGEWPDGPNREEWMDTQRRDLLHPAFAQGDSEVDEKYLALVQRYGPVREHPEFHSYSTGGWAGDRSPIASDAIMRMSDQELVRFLKEFVPDGGGIDGPTYRGLASAIATAVRSSDDGFAPRIRLFAELPRPCQHGLLRGLKERWADDKRDIDWSATLAVLHAIVSAHDFRSDLLAERRDGWEPTVQWVVSDIADLMKAAAASERPVAPSLYRDCFDVLRTTLEAVPRDLDQPDDAVSHTINAPRGRLLESLIHLGLAMRRHEGADAAKVGESWKVLGPVFNEELASSDSGANPEFAALAGMYCANLHFLNAEWTETNFNRLFSSTNESAWRCAAQGFAYQRYLYGWLFERLVSGGHLRKMVNSEDLPDAVTQKALQFLALAYLEGAESLGGGGLLDEVIGDLRVDDLSQISWFFWTLRANSEPNERASKILAFWLRVAQQIRDQRAQLPELQSALSQLAVFVTDLTRPITEALIDAAPHAQAKHHGYQLIENLARLVQSHPKEVASIFRAAMTGFLPDYRTEDVIECVMGLAGAGEFDEAEWICNRYAELGSTLLKESYEKIRAMQRSGSAVAHSAVVPTVPTN
ncbi:MAG TPA: hypothetical protein VNQ32_08790 [Steroidobacteraceae bacterium]|nr:hypothetical protein [Steroidobacteraceae bacterium]